MQGLQGKIAVVTGGASGIGRATAQRLAAEGTIVEILDKDDASPVCAQIAAAGGVAQFTHCDVTDESQIAAAVRVIQDRYGKLDILINNAGILAPRKPWYEKSREEIVRFVQVNYLGAYLLTQALYPLIKRSDRGRIILIASRTAFTGNPGMAGYVESKAAVIGLAKVLAQELGTEGITVNAVAPGMISTPGTRANSPEEAFDHMTATQAIRRRVTPQHVAGLIAFLASEDAEMITGQTILCDGGSFLH